MARKFILSLLFISVFWLGGGVALRPVSGHAEYDHSDPAADAVLAVAPTRVQIWFTQELFRRQGMNTIVVYDAAGQRVDRDDSAIDDDDRTLLTVSLAPALSAGRYTVRWQALSSEDGHEGQGEFSFTVGATTPAASAAASTTVTTTTAITLAATQPPAATPTSVPVPTATAAPTPVPTTAPATPTAGLPCLGGAAPLLLVGGLLVISRRRRDGV